MPSVTLALPKKLAAFVESQVKAGRYRDVSGYVKALIKADEVAQARLGLRARLREGMESEFEDVTPETWNDLRQTVQERLKSQLREGLESGPPVRLTEERLEQLRLEAEK